MKFSRWPSFSFALAAAAFVTAPVSAQTTDTGLPNLSTIDQSTSSTTAASSASSTGSTDTATTTDSSTATNTNSQSTSIQSTTVAITGGSSASTIGTIPTITGGSSATTGGGLPTGLPTITGGYRIVAPSVPPTSGDGWSAPYLRTSNMPDGTVFIIVGAILGFLAIAVLLWRGLVAWSLHRSVQRAAAAQYSDLKSTFRTPTAPSHKYSDRDSTISLGVLGAKGGKKPPRTPTAQGDSRASLFFSPTAGAAGAGGSANPGNRGSSYLPAGYYAAGASQLGNGQGMAHIGAGHNISLSNFGSSREGYSRARSMGNSPPDSPAVRPVSSGLFDHSYGASRSTLNLNDGGSVRAPSAYLDELFDGDNALPVPGHGDPPRRNRG